MGSIAVGADDAGAPLKERLADYLRRQGYQVEDFGNGEGVDYPDVAAAVAEAVARGRHDRALLVCGTGLGMAIRSTPATATSVHHRVPAADPPAVSTSSTGLVSSPRPVIEIRTRSPERRVSSGGGTIEVPVSSTAPKGRSWPRHSQSTSSPSPRFMSATEQRSENSSAPSRSMARAISMSWGSGASATGTRQGPSPQLPRYSLAWGRYRGFSPSMDRDDTSSPMV